MFTSGDAGTIKALGTVFAGFTVTDRVVEALYHPESLTKNLAIQVPELLYACQGLMECDGVAQVPSPQHHE